MKFTNGNWLMRPVVQVSSPAQTYEVETTADTFMVYAPAHVIHPRGSTLGGQLLNVRFSAPMPDVIGVRVSRSSGTEEHGPQFPLRAQDNPTDICTCGDTLSLTSGRLRPRQDAQFLHVSVQQDGV